VFSELAARRGFLEAVVFSGGEPTIQSGIARAIRDVRDMGFAVGLHTAGISPSRLASVLPFLNWVGLDIKAPFDGRYNAITRHPDSFKSAARALDLVLASGIPCEIRTTVHPDLLGDADLRDLSTDLAARGAPRTRIQPFRPEGCVDSALVGAGGASLQSSGIGSSFRL